MDSEWRNAAIRYNRAARRVLLSIDRICLLLRANPYWHLQPRVPAGHPHGGRWRRSGPLAAGPLPLLVPAVRAALRVLARRIAPLLRRLPDDWTGEQPDEATFDETTRRIGPPTPRRPGHQHLRFRTAEELTRYLGPAGPGRHWHHIVEQRLAGHRFPPELVHSTDNVVNLPIEVHRQVSARMSSKFRHTEGKTLRDWLEPKSFEEQYRRGLELIREVKQELRR